MKFPKLLTKKLSRPATEADSTSIVYPLIHEAHNHLLSEQYDKARIPLLRAVEFRDRLRDAAAIDYVLASLDATWLFTERYQEAIAFFSDYISRYPYDSAAYGGRAAALWYLGRLQEAVRDYSHALDLKSDDILSLSGRGQVLAELGENGRAIQDLNLALQTVTTVSAPNSSWAEWYQEAEAFIRNGKGFALAGWGDTANAMNEFETSIGLSPENAWVYHNRAKVHDRAGSSESAIADYEKSLAKKGPALSPLRKEHAQTRLRDLSNRL
jgi:tetratricopeptide (TPR) repeat protein